MKQNLRIILFIFATIAFILVMLMFGFKCEENNDVNNVVEETVQNIEVIKIPITKTLEEEVEKIEEPILKSLGEFKLTAYCPCYQCCGQYSLNRPIDENGNEIVYGSIGEKLISGVSIAVDPNIIPYGTEIIINDNTYIAHDTGGAIKGNRIDVYHSSHQEALEFGVQYAEVFLVESNNN